MRAVQCGGLFVKRVNRLSNALAVSFDREPEMALGRICDGEAKPGDDRTLDYYIHVCESLDVLALLDRAQGDHFPEPAGAGSRWRNNTDVIVPVRQTERIVRAALVRSADDRELRADFDVWWRRWRTIRAFAARRGSLVARLIVSSMDVSISDAVRRLIIDQRLKPDAARGLLQAWPRVTRDDADVDGVVAAVRTDLIIMRLRLADPILGEADREGMQRLREMLNSMHEAVQVFAAKVNGGEPTSERTRPWTPPEHPSAESLVERAHEGLPEVSALRPMTRESVQAWRDVGYRRAESSIQIDGTRVMLALEVYRAERGQLPADLGALVPGTLPALPFDPYGEGPFRYRLTEPGTPGPGYVLWSIALDGRDDGGTPPASGFNNQSTWNQPDVSGDYVLTHLP